MSAALELAPGAAVSHLFTVGAAAAEVTHGALAISWSEAAPVALAVIRAEATRPGRATAPWRRLGEEGPGFRLWTNRCPAVV